MTQYTDIPELNKQLVSTERRIAHEGILLSKVKEIPYGVQIEGEASHGGKGKVTCYFSKKKGLSVTDNSKNSVSEAIASYFLNKENEEKAPFRPTIGTDEAGKGDFFGPLVCAAFYIESEEMEQELLELGIRDSKKLSDTKIREMARTMFRRWPENFVTMAPGVSKYNDLYDKVGNLNKLLGWMHGRIILDLHNRCVEHNWKVDDIIIDKFGDLSNVSLSNKELKGLPLSAVTKGEEKEVAIAAASVIARDAFLFRMKKLSEEAGMTIPLGAGEPVKKAGTAFLNKNGRSALRSVAKIHFKTAKQL